jgi:DNA-binding NarL/FixJ family response regulator
VKILVVDDHALVREGLSQVLKVLGENVTIFQSATCKEAFAIAQSHHDLDLVLLDYHLPDMNGLEALRIFRDKHPELPVVLLSGQANIQIMQQSIQSGAAGFISKSGISEDLLEAVRQVLEGEVFIPAELKTAVQSGSPLRLTQKQEQVLRGLLDGRSNKEIGDGLHVSEETIKTHVAAILRHFEVQNRTQAVMKAIEQGFRPSSSSV